MIPQQFAVLAACLSVLAGSRYAISTLRGNTKPNRISWMLFLLIGLIILFAEISKGIGFYSLLGVGALLFNVSFVILSSFINPNAYWKIDRNDYILGAIALAGILLWRITDTPELAITFAIAADFFATLPIVRKAISSPETENGDSFLIWTCSWILMVLIIDEWSYAESVFPVYLVSFNGLLAYLILVRPRLKKSTK